MAETKSRILYILKYLLQNTDAEHYATTGDILTYLKENGISCDRKTIPGDIAKLCDIGIDIEEERSRENRYSLSSHLFTLPELKLLIDAVESSKFITVKKSAELIEKLSQMSSVHQASRWPFWRGYEVHAHQYFSRTGAVPGNTQIPSQ